MVKVRLEGLPDEVRRIADAMESTGCVLERPREYQNRESMIDCQMEGLTTAIPGGKR